MKQIIFKITVMAVALLFVSCDWFRFPSGADSGYYVYITGEAGRSVDISYLQRDKGDSPRKNTTVNETVTLPFFKDVRVVQFMNSGIPDCFLQINSKNDTSTKAVIFDNALLLSDSICRVFFCMDN
jgi:hypothetical protein